MSIVYFLTTNKGKYLSVQRVCEKYGIKLIQLVKEVRELRTDSFDEIAIDKCLKGFEIIHKPVIALDAGLIIPSLNGFPGTFTNFVLNTIGIEGILKLLEKKDRYCYFYHVLAYYDKNLEKPITFSHKVEGIVSEFPKGERKEWWSDLFSIFKIKVGEKLSSKVVGEMSDEEWNITREKLYSEIETCYEKFAKWYTSSVRNSDSDGDCDSFI
jgi:XTP/dITP diphosphohydrolase